VRRLKAFRDHFEDFAVRSLIIGGTACDLAMADAGLGLPAALEDERRQRITA